MLHDGGGASGDGTLDAVALSEEELLVIEGSFVVIDVVVSEEEAISSELDCELSVLLGLGVAVADSVVEAVIDVVLEDVVDAIVDSVVDAVVDVVVDAVGDIVVDSVVGCIADNVLDSTLLRLEVAVLDVVARSAVNPVLHSVLLGLELAVTDLVVGCAIDSVPGSVLSPIVGAPISVARKDGSVGDVLAEGEVEDNSAEVNEGDVRVSITSVVGDVVVSTILGVGDDPTEINVEGIIPELEAVVEAGCSPAVETVSPGGPLGAIVRVKTACTTTNVSAFVTVSGIS